MNPVAEANFSGVATPATQEPQKRGGIGSFLGKVVGIEVKSAPLGVPQSTVSAAPESGLNNSVSDFNSSPVTTVSGEPLMPVASADGSAVVGSAPSAGSSFEAPNNSIPGEPQEGVQMPPETPVSSPTNPPVPESPPVSHVEQVNSSPVQNQTNEGSQISSIDQGIQSTITPKEPEIVSTAPVPEMAVSMPPVVEFQPTNSQVVTNITESPEVSTVEPVQNSDFEPQNGAASGIEEHSIEANTPINFLERYLLKHHLKDYVQENGEIDGKKLTHDAATPAKLQEIDPRIAKLVKGLTDRGLSLEDELIAAGVEEVYIEDQKKAA